MYQTFRVKNFRCFKDLRIEDLGRVNLIAGRNNTGKTALMEAMYLLAKPLRPKVLSVLQGHRGIDASRGERRETWELFFSGMDTRAAIEISGTGSRSTAFDRQLTITEIRNDGDTDYGKHVNEYFTEATRFGLINATKVTRHFTLFLRFAVSNSTESEELPFSPVYLPSSPDMPVYENLSADLGTPHFIPIQGRFDSKSLADRFSRLELGEDSKSVICHLKKLDPRLTDIRVLSRSGEPSIWGQVNNKLFPLRLMGEGANRFASFILTMLAEEPDYLFIDEIENGIHYSVQKDLWKAISQEARKLGIQVFATTHSLEMIRAAYEAFNEDGKLEEFRYHRLDQDAETGEIEAVTYNELDLNAVAAFEFDFEVRG